MVIFNRGDYMKKNTVEKIESKKITREEIVEEIRRLKLENEWFRVKYNGNNKRIEYYNMILETEYKK